MAARRSNDKRQRSNAGTVFWLAAIVIVLFIFALNWGKVQETLARTNFHEIVKTQGGSDMAPAAPSAESAAGSKAAPAVKAPLPSATPKGAPEEDSEGVGAGPSTPKPSPGPVAKAPQPADKAVPQAEAKPAAAKPAAAPDKEQPSARLPASTQAPKARSAALYFVRIDDDGVIVRQEVARQVPVSDSPLLDSLAALLKGPSEAEIRKKLISLVPQGTKLLSAQVRGSTAFLNFNEAFMYNHYGIEGYAGQLKQVVYTATSFPTVQDVQILIEGEKHDYLGGEGVFIGKPLSRNSF